MFNEWVGIVVTERMEWIEAGTAKLVGTSQNVILTEVRNLLNNDNIIKLCQTPIILMEIEKLVNIY